MSVYKDNNTVLQKLFVQKSIEIHNKIFLQKEYFVLKAYFLDITVRTKIYDGIVTPIACKIGTYK